MLQSCAMIAAGRAVSLASDKGMLDVTALPIIGYEALTTLEGDDNLCRRMRNAFSRNLPADTVTATVKKEPVEMPSPTVSLPRQHVKLSVQLPITQVRKPSGFK